MKHYITALTIAGSDPSGGAGVQADLKTFTALGVYGMSAITAVTVQNTCGVKGFCALSPENVYDQICTVMDDIPPCAVKTGMVADAPTLDAIVRALKSHRPKFLVVDPVMVATSGHSLMRNEALDILKKELLPLADLVTPNLDEFYALAGISRPVKGSDCFDLATADDMAKSILSLGVKALLVKGGHLSGNTKTDLLYTYDNGRLDRVSLSANTVDTPNTHGTGCTLSAAITAYLACGYNLYDAVNAAKKYLTTALAYGSDVTVGHGHGPVNHLCLSTPPLYGFDSCGNSAVPQSVAMQFITHQTERFNYLESALLALEGGCRWIQLRMKNADEGELEHTARLLLPVCRRYGAILLIDDNVDVALRVGADGVHLGKNDMPVDSARALVGNGFIIGGTANTYADVERLVALGADYIGCGPYRYTTTKQNLSPILGLEGYREIIKKKNDAGIHLPLVAIGGIGSDDIPDIVSTGVDGIALSGSVLRADDPVGEMRKVIAKLRQVK